MDVEAGLFEDGGELVEEGEGALLEDGEEGLCVVVDGHKFEDDFDEF